MRFRKPKPSDIKRIYKISAEAFEINLELIKELFLLAQLLKLL